MGRPKKILEIDSVKVRYKTLADGRRSVYFDYSKNGKRFYDFPKLYLLPEADSETRRKNKATMKVVEEKRRELTLKMLNVGVDEVKTKDIALGPNMLLSDWMEVHADQQEKRGIKTADLIRRTRRMLMAVDADIRMKNVDKNFCLRFIDYMRNDYRTRTGSKLDENTGWSYQSKFRAALNAAVREGIIEKSPWDLVGVPEKFMMKESKREYLTIDEVKKLMATPCYMPVVKQTFLFCCFTGLRYSDMEALRWKDIFKDGNQWYIHIVMVKTREPVVVPLSEEARKLLPDQGNRSPDETVFNNLPDHREIGNYLHNWAWSAGIDKYLTFHCARHTFATSLLTVGVDLYVVSKLMGHSSTKNTQIYAKIVDKKKDDAVNLADSVFATPHTIE